MTDQERLDTIMYYRVTTGSHWYYHEGIHTELPLCQVHVQHPTKPSLHAGARHPSGKKRLQQQECEKVCISII